MSAQRDGVEFGWGAPPMKDQHPILPDDVAAHFDADNLAVIRLSMRGIITPSQRDAALKKLTAKIGTSIRLALAERDKAKGGDANE